jgi:hypothetical protein
MTLPLPFCIPSETFLLSFFRTLAKKCSVSFPLKIGASLIGFATATSHFITESDIERLPVEMYAEDVQKIFLMHKE